ncbi:MAG: aminopeptidase P family protein [Bacilli bacterium]|nr:aminopeptidase P family protein [Bacilli bacterium]
MKRVENIRKIMKSNNLDAFLVTSMKNIRYLSGFTGSTGMVLITSDNQYFLTDFRYLSQSSKQCLGFEIVNVGYEYAENLEKLVSKGLVGFEGNIMTYDEYIHFTNTCKNLSFKSVNLDKLRMIKDDDEVEKIIKANEISIEALNYVLNEVLIPNKTTEIELRSALEAKMNELGASGPSFDIIVASGIRSSLPHGVASDKVIEAGDMLTIDYGCFYKGYVSDITRTYAVSKLPDDELVKIYKIVLEAQLLGVKAVKPGIKICEVDKVVRDYITKKGYGKYFGHGTGHGIGLEIHEEPYVRGNYDTILEPGMIITIEPGIYLPDLGGVRIEDDVLVTETGYKILTNLDKELKIIGK